MRMLFITNKLEFICLLGIIILVSLFSFILPITFSMMVEQVLPSQNKAQFYWLMNIILGLIVFRFVLNALQDYVFLTLRSRIEKSVSEQFLHKILTTVPPETLDRLGYQQVSSRLLIWLSNFQYCFSELVYFCGYALVVSTVVFVILFLIAPELAYVGLVFVGLHSLNFLLHAPLSTSVSGQYNERKAQSTQFLASALKAKHIINVFALHQVLAEQWRHLNQRLYQAQYVRELVSNGQAFWQTFLRYSQFICFVYIGMFAVAQSQLGVGELILSILLMGFAFQPIYRLNKVTKSFGEIRSQLIAITNIIDAQGEQAGDEMLAEVSHISISQLSLNYANQLILAPTSETFKRDQIYLIQGPSGAGKSSFLKLLCGATKPSSGVVYWNNKAVQELCLEQISAQLSWTGQHSAFTDATLLQNLTTFSPVPNLAYLMSLSKRLECDFIDEQQLQNHLLSAHIPFSGGQQQRLNILRGAYQGGSVRILDEPTANLDPDSAQHILDYLYASKEQYITFVVSHHKTTQAIADQVFKLEKGCLERIEKELQNVFV